MEELLWAIRKAKSDDLAFIYETWKQSFRVDSDFGKSFSGYNQTYNEEMTKLIDRILMRWSTIVYVACLKEEPNVIIGYLVTDLDQLIHYSFTKGAFRRQGVFKSLRFHAGSPKIFTSRTSHFQPILDKNREMVYNSFLLFYTQDLTTEEK